MKYFQLIIITAFLNLPVYCQNPIHSIFDYVLNNYLPDRVQSKSFYLQRQFIRYTDIYSLINLDTIQYLRNDLIISELILKLSNSECMENRLHPKKFGYKAINQSHIENILNTINVENGIGYKNPISDWESFKKHYPDCQAIVSLTCPLVSKNSDKFIIYIDYYVPSDKGFGDLIVFEKMENTWKAIKEINMTKPLLEQIIIGN